MIPLGCLHAAASNVAILEAAAARIGLPAGSLRHMIRADLLAEAEEAGEDSALRLRIAARTSEALEQLAPGCMGLLLTCSTLGDVASFAQGRLAIPVLGTEAALLRRAVEAPGPALVLCAAPSTLEPTGRRLREAAADRGVIPPALRLIPGAWARFKAGEEAAYLAMILEAVAAARAEGFATVALAQVSMAAAVEDAPSPAPLASPEVGLRALMAEIKRR